MATVNSFSNSKLVIWMVFLSTAIQATAGFARDASSVFKAVLAFLCWFSAILSIVQYCKNKGIFTRQFRRVYVILSLLIFYSILYSLLIGEVQEGNKYLTLMGNMYSAPNLLGFFFISSVLTISGIRYLKTITIWYLVMSILLLLYNYDTTVQSYFLIYPLTYLFIFFPYVNNWQKLIILLSFSLSIFAFMGGGRQAIIFLGGNVLAFASWKWLDAKHTYWISCSLIFLPWILLAYSVYVGDSIFNILSTSVSEEGGLNTDTRTFLYLEFSEDLTNQSMFTILFGRGATAYYFSSWFDAKQRLGIEIPILEWILQVGLIYIIFFTVIILYSLKNLYKKGCARITIIISILIASYYFNCFVSNLNGCNLGILAFWVLVYYSNNTRMLAMSDEQLSKCFK